MARDFGLIKMHVVDKVDFFIDHGQTEGYVNIRGPSSAMHGPAASAFLVEEHEVFHGGGRDHLDRIVSISEREIDYVVPIPEHVHLNVYIFAVSG